jgi:hypothetical protein
MIDIAQPVNRGGGCYMMAPKSAPTGFVKQRWAAQIMPGGTIDRRY